MKKFLLSTLIAVLFSAPAFARGGDYYYAEQREKPEWRLYLRADAGVTYSSMDIKGEEISGFEGLYNFAVGAQYDRWRLEAAYQERATFSDAVLVMLANTVAVVDEQAVMANAFYDYYQTKHFALYAGLGAGVNKYDAKVTSFGFTETDDGYSFIGGAYLGMSFNFKHVGIDLGVDYYYIDKPQMNSYVPKIGLRLTF